MNLNEIIVLKIKSYIYEYSGQFYYCYYYFLSWFVLNFIILRLIPNKNFLFIDSSDAYYPIIGKYDSDGSLLKSREILLRLAPSGHFPSAIHWIGGKVVLTSYEEYYTAFYVYLSLLDSNLSVEKVKKFSMPIEGEVERFGDSYARLASVGDPTEIALAITSPAAGYVNLFYCV